MTTPDGINFPDPEDQADEGDLAPSVFFSDHDLPDPATQLNEPLPQAWSEGGVIEGFKRAVVLGLREALQATMTGTGAGVEKFSIDIEYPVSETQYPGIWVQFQLTQLQRAGLSMETWVQEAGAWASIQQWIFNGNITLTIAALSSKERDRLSDAVIAQLAFSRPPDMVISDASRDSKQMKGLITALNANPYIAITLNTDQINSGGQTVTGGTPWAQNVLLYEDNYTVSCHGQFNIEFRYDGVYTLRALDIFPHVSADSPEFNDVQWRGQVPPR